jgi:hypothetical protein
MRLLLKDDKIQTRLKKHVFNLHIDVFATAPAMSNPPKIGLGPDGVILSIKKDKIILFIHIFFYNNF